MRRFWIPVVFVAAGAAVAFVYDRGAFLPAEIAGRRLTAFLASSPRPAVSGAEKRSEILLSVPGVLEPAQKTLQAKAGIVIHVPSGKVLAEQDGFAAYPIASLTKLMGAMVALDAGVSMEREISMTPEEYTVGGNLRIVPNEETVRVRDLLYASITGSANNAALALARSVGMSREEFVREMNRQAVVMGFEQFSFEDPSGLSPKNTGSAYEVARLAGIALTEYPLIRDAASRESYTVVTVNTSREHVIKNPNTLFQRFRERFSFSKTGYLDEALYCLILARETPRGLLVAVTLGHPSKQGGEDETLALLDVGEERLAGGLPAGETLP